MNQPDLPDTEAIDLLVIIGDQMSVNDENELPWLVSEKPVLGICLGAQMIDNAIGAKIFLNPVKEIGWFPIQ